MPPPADAELIALLTAGDEDALMALHARFAGLVYSVAWRVLEEEAAAEEVTQDVFMRLWRNPRAYDPQKGHLGVWLMTVARRLAIDRYRQRRSRTPRAGLLFLDENPDATEHVLKDDGLETLRRTLQSLLEQIPAEQREALELSYFHGLSAQEIAEHLRSPVATIKSRLQRGMGRLRALWFAEKNGH